MIKRFADKIFKTCCRRDYFSDIRGDLEEFYLKRLSQKGNLSAQIDYLIEVLLLLRPSILKPIKIIKPGNPMLKNHMITCLRNLSRNKGYTSVNVLGLTLGIVSTFFIGVFVLSETSYDQHHIEGQQLFRIHTISGVNGQTTEMATSPPGLAEKMMLDIPEVQSIVRVVQFLGIKKNFLKVGDDVYTEENGYLADPDFFQIFNYSILHGNRDYLLTEPQSIVLSSTLSNRLFGALNPVGNQLTIINEYGESEYRITGVYDDAQIKSHLAPQFICSMNSGFIGKYVMSNDRLKGNNFLYTYARLEESAQPRSIEERFPQFLGKYLGEVEHTHALQPLSDIYLHSNASNETGISGNIRTVQIMTTIAIMILLIACANFANMASSQAINRAKEIGLRKTFGAKKSMLIQQFLGESFLITLISCLVSVILITLLYSPFEVTLGIVLSNYHLWQAVALLGAIALLTTFLAGMYPAFYLSTLKLDATLQLAKGSQKGGGLLRKGLVLFQYVIGILLLFAAYVINQQMTYIDSKPLGFQANNLLTIPLPTERVASSLQEIKSEFLKINGVESVAGTTYTTAESVMSDNKYFISGTQDHNGVTIRQNDVDYGFLEVMGFSLLAGTVFEKELDSENHQSVVLNETAANALGHTPESIVNQRINTVDDEGPVSYKVIGVVEDFNTETLHRPIEPYLFAMRPGRTVSTLMLKTNSNDLSTLVVSLESSWRALFPSVPFDYSFLDQQIQARYEKEVLFSKIIAVFTLLAVVLCLLGIFALMSFTVHESLKEISIRKILGASVIALYVNQSLKFLLLIGLSSILAIPAGIMIMNHWLDVFSYRIDIEILHVLVPVLIILISTALVISWKLFNAVSINPATILRRE